MKLFVVVIHIIINFAGDRRKFKRGLLSLPELCMYVEENLALSIYITMPKPLMVCVLHTTTLHHHKE